MQRYHEIKFSPTKYANAYRVIDRRPNGGFRVLGTVAKIDGLWEAQMGTCKSERRETRMDAVEDCIYELGMLPA